jgi:lysophospholipase L1-like esterase
MSAKTAALLLVAAATVAGSAVAIASIHQEAPAAPAPRPVVVETVEPAPPVETPEPVTFAPAGDSITAWAQGNLETWATYAIAEDLVRVDGFAEGGQKIGYIAEHTPACGCDVVAIMAGTNDMGTERWATPLGQRSESLVSIVVKSGARHALIIAVPPLNGGGSWAAEWNAELARLSAFYGWDFIDPWGPYRASNGDWLPGTASDHAHPTPAVQAEVGAVLHDAIVTVAR